MSKVLALYLSFEQIRSTKTRNVPQKPCDADNTMKVAVVGIKLQVRHTFSSFEAGIMKATQNRMLSTKGLWIKSLQKKTLTRHLAYMPTFYSVIFQSCIFSAPLFMP